MYAQAAQAAFVTLAKGFSPMAAAAACREYTQCTHRRAEALGLQYEARLRGLSDYFQAAQAAFVTLAKGFSPMAAAYEARLRGLPIDVGSGRAGGLCNPSQGL